MKNMQNLGGVIGKNGYLNPLIFLRPLEFALGSPDNAFIGITGKYKLYKNGFIYGQLGLDDLGRRIAMHLRL